MACTAAARLPAPANRQTHHKRGLQAARRLVAPAGAPAGLSPCRRKAAPARPRAVSRDFGPELSFDDFDFPKAVDDSPYGDPYVRGAPMAGCLFHCRRGSGGRSRRLHWLALPGRCGFCLSCAPSALFACMFCFFCPAGPHLRHCGCSEARARGAAGGPCKCAWVLSAAGKVWCRLRGSAAVRLRKLSTRRGSLPHCALIQLRLLLRQNAGTTLLSRPANCPSLPPATQAEVEAGRAALQDTRLALNAAEGPNGSPEERQRLRMQLAQQAEAIDTASVQVGSCSRG